MIEQNKLIASQFIELAFAGRMEEAQALLSPTATWWVLGRPEKLKVAGTRDRAGIKRLLSGVSKTLPAGMQVEIKGLTAEGERVAVEVEALGTCTDGRIYRNQYHFLIGIRECFIETVREYMDTLEAFDLMQPPRN